MLRFTMLLFISQDFITCCNRGNRKLLLVAEGYLDADSYPTRGGNICGVI